MRKVFFDLGRANALALREAAKEMTGTQIIDKEFDAPLFNPKTDYTQCPISTPVRDDGQIWLLLQPHNASHYSGRPASLRALWGLAHTTNPHKAKAWVDPYGTSGMYMKDECYKDADGIIYRCLADNMIYTAAAYPQGWEVVTL